MVKRSVTTTILIALLTFIPPVAYVLWSLQQHTFIALDAERRVTSQVDAIGRTLSSIATAQQAYVAPGQLDQPLFEETTRLLSHLVEQVNELASMLQFAEAAAHLEPLKQSVDALQAADARARENLNRGQELMAADVIYSDGRNSVETITARLQYAQAAHQAAADDSHRRTSRLSWLLFGALTLAAAAACAALAKRSRRLSLPMSDAAAPADHSIDPVALASLCTDVARVADVRALEHALDRAARLLDASSVMLWMSAGNQLFPALAYGLPADTLPRLKPIARDADNAASDAWRTGRVVRNAAAIPDIGRAIVAPLVNPDGAIGVLAVELTVGRALDSDREAAVAVIAAQLSTVVSAWPAASVPHSSKASEARSA